MHDSIPLEFQLYSNPQPKIRLYDDCSVDIHPLSFQLLPRHLDFLHEFLMCCRHIIERHNSPPKLEEQICAEGN